MARFAVLALAVAAACLMATRVSATTAEECPTTCLAPYTKDNPSKDCIRMCNACLGATGSGCTSYFLPYFYGNQYSKHFACWETCPMPKWAWAMIGVSIAIMCLMCCCCVWCCYKRRKANREAAMAMYQQQLAEAHPTMNAKPKHVTFQQPAAQKPAAPAQQAAPASAQPVPPKANTVSSVMSKLMAPFPKSGRAHMDFSAAGFSMPSRSAKSGQNWVSNPMYSQLNDEEEAYSVQNPYNRGGR